MILSAPIKRGRSEVTVLGLAAVVSLCALTWALSHTYRGIIHDGRLYALQALVRIAPLSLGQDVFLKFGSQDRFTVFSPIYAAVVRLFGLEPAASALTLASQLAVLAGAWVLARRVLSASMALLGVAVLMAIPGDYGSDRIFTCIEAFLTPRMAAESLVLGSLAAALGARRILAVGLVVMAALLHPIMAMAGVCALLLLYLGLPKPLLTSALVIIAATGLILAAFLVPDGQWGRLDPAWLDLVANRSANLFIAHWQIDDWARLAVPLVTLIIGIYTLPFNRGRELCLVVAMTVVAGLILTLLACDWLHLTLFTQLQPWRLQWLGTVCAAVLLPEIVRLQWRSALAGRATAILLIAAWIFASNSYACAAALAALCSSGYSHRLKAREVRLVFWGAGGMLVIALLWRVASNLEFTDAHYMELRVPLWIRDATSFTHDGTLPVAIISLAVWLVRINRGRPVLVALSGLACAACAALLPYVWTSWTEREYTSERVAQFADFRAHIPPGADVFWPESPVAAWLLLDRPSYLSLMQTSGVVFSRQSALELDRRATALNPAVPRQYFMGWDNRGSNLNLSPQQLKRACGTGVFPFLVTARDLGIDPVAEVASASGPASKKIRLYRCPAPAAAQTLAAAAT
jgi:hypothetical protein